MSSIIVLLLAFQVGDATTPTTEPTAQPSAQPAKPGGSVTSTESRRLGFELPAVYSHNYATKYFGLDDGPPPRTVYVPVQQSYPPAYYPGYSYYYPGYRNFFFAPAPFIRGNYFNPSPFFRSPGQPGQITPRPMPPRPAPHRGGGGGGRGGRR